MISTSIAHQFCTRIASSYYNEAHNGQHCSSFITPCGKFCSGTVYVATWQCLVYNTTAHSLRSHAQLLPLPTTRQATTLCLISRGRGGRGGRGEKGGWRVEGGKEGKEKVRELSLSVWYPGYITCLVAAAISTCQQFECTIFSNLNGKKS